MIDESIDAAPHCGYDDGYNQAISDVLAAIEDTNKVLTDKTSKGITVVYKETLKNVIKSLKK